MLLLLLGPGLKGGQRHQVSSFVPNGKTHLERIKAHFESRAEEKKTVQVSDGNESLSSVTGVEQGSAALLHSQGLAPCSSAALHLV